MSDAARRCGAAAPSEHENDFRTGRAGCSRSTSARRRDRLQANARVKPTSPSIGLRRVLIVAGVMAAALMQTLDSTITNVALPTIQGNLGASQDEATWVITAYVIAAIVVIPLTPWLMNRFGRRNYFLVSIVGFTLASVLCGTSESLTALIAARAVQGAFGGGLLTMGQSIMRDTFPPAQLRGEPRHLRARRDHGPDARAAARRLPGRQLFVELVLRDQHPAGHLLP